MAILNSIRKRGFFLIIIIAMALFAFVLDGVINKGTSSAKGETNIATVNGVDISREDFMRQVENTQRSIGGGAGTNQAMNIVWDRELRKALLEEQYEALGLTAETAQINNSLKLGLASNPAFLNEAGLFDEGKMQEYIATVKATNPVAYQQWLDYEKTVESNVLETSYFNLVKGGLITTLAEGEQEYRFQNDKINIEFVQVPYSKIADEDVTVTDAEIEKYIRDHAKDFEVEPQVDIQYVSFSEDPSESDMEDARTSMMSLLEPEIEFNTVTNKNDTIPSFSATTNAQEFVNKKSDNPYVDQWVFEGNVPAALKDTISQMEMNSVFGPYKTAGTYNLSKLIDSKKLPDSVKARHILIPFLGARSATPDAQTEALAKVTADSILRVVRGNRSKFPSLVKEFSSDQGSLANEGRYDWFNYATMVAPFRDFCFESNVGDIGVVKTDFGFHVIELEGQKNLQTAYKVATITKEIDASEKTLNDIFSNATKFELGAADGDFTEIAKEKSLVVNPVNKIGELDANIPGVGSNRSIVSWAFREDVKVGDVKRFSIPTGYVIAQVTRRNGKALMSIAEASGRVSPILRNEKKALKIRESISSTDLNEVASSQNVTVSTATALTMANPTIADAGTEPKVVGAAFGKKAGETSQLIDGKKGVYMVRVLAVNNAPVLQNYSTFADQLNAKTTPSINTNIYNALKNAAKIEDNRANFY